jgi:NTE family protein
VVLSGGGAKGAFQLGALDYLIREKGLDFEVIAGVSVGSLTAAVLAQGSGQDGLHQELEDLKGIWLSIEDSSAVFKARFLGRIASLLWKPVLYLPLLWKSSAYLPTPLEALLELKVDPKRLKESGSSGRGARAPRRRGRRGGAQLPGASPRSLH